MEHENRLTQKIVFGLLASILVLALTGNLAAQEGQKMRRFLTKPLVIEDQGSFFVGGAPKVTNYAIVPAANQTAQPGSDHDRPDVRPIRDTGEQEAQRATGHHGPRFLSHGCLFGVNAGWTGGLVSVLRAEGHLNISRRSSRARTFGIR